MRLSAAAARNGFAVTATETSRPCEAAAAALQFNPAALIVGIKPDEDHAALAASGLPFDGPKWVFLADGVKAGPLDRLVALTRGAVVSQDASNAVVIGTLITLIGSAEGRDER